MRSCMWIGCGGSSAAPASMTRQALEVVITLDAGMFAKMASSRTGGMSARSKDDGGLAAVHGVSLAVRGGEIVGIAGVSGNGQRELAEVLAGQRKPRAGDIAQRRGNHARCETKPGRKATTGSFDSGT